ncbi:hypothetical protein HK102_000459 [Quaeritorhiza haematococci]|nr:hypothetical protein HK102_000459 [Quaeritorhiza haematococci]
MSMHPRFSASIALASLALLLILLNIISLGVAFPRLRRGANLDEFDSNPSHTSHPRPQVFAFEVADPEVPAPANTHERLLSIAESIGQQTARIAHAANMQASTAMRLIAINFGLVSHTIASIQNDANNNNNNDQGAHPVRDEVTPNAEDWYLVDQEAFALAEVFGVDRVNAQRVLDVVAEGAMTAAAVSRGVLRNPQVVRELGDRMRESFNTVWESLSKGASSIVDGPSGAAPTAVSGNDFDEGSVSHVQRRMVREDVTHSLIATAVPTRTEIEITTTATTAPRPPLTLTLPSRRPLIAIAAQIAQKLATTAQSLNLEFPKALALSALLLVQAKPQPYVPFLFPLKFDTSVFETAVTVGALPQYLGPELKEGSALMAVLEEVWETVRMEFATLEYAYEMFVDRVGWEIMWAYQWSMIRNAEVAAQRLWQE